MAYYMSKDYELKNAGHIVTYYNKQSKPSFRIMQRKVCNSNDSCSIYPFFVERD